MKSFCATCLANQENAVARNVLDGELAVLFCLNQTPPDFDF
jgi:hypothetical protein